jgi:hypothetical protein
MKHDQRKFFRINKNLIDCKVTWKGNCCDGVLIDESIEGLRVGLEDAIPFSTRDSVSISVDGNDIVARPRNLFRSSDEQYALGLERVTAQQNVSLHYHLIRQFVDLSGCSIPCTITEQDSGHRTLIQIADGKEFVVETQRLKKLTIGERAKQFEDPKQLHRVVNSYRALLPAVVFESIEDIIDLEFSVSTK